MRILLRATTALTATLAAAPILAQTETENTQTGGIIEDVVVTAQRRSESVQDVPIAISAFSADQLRSQGVANTLQLGQFVPNLVAQNNTGIGSANAFYLRGLGNTETIATFDPPVGTYVDDIYMSRQNANNINLFDVERVEVLRGPQGTLFGRNTTGGAINVILKEPGEKFGGFVELSYGRYEQKIARGSVDLPVSDKFAFKVSGYWQEDDGFVKNVTTGDRLNDDDGWGGRIGLRAELTDSLRWVASYARIDHDGENILNFECNPANPSDCDGRFVTTGLREGSTASISPYAPLVISGRKANYLMGNRTSTDLITSNLELELSEQTSLSFITGYIDMSQQYALDFFDGRSGPSLANPEPPVRGFTRGGFTILNDGTHEQFSQEIKLNGTLGDGTIEYVAGGYYLDERNRTDFADVFSIFNAAVPGGVPLLLSDRVLHNDTEAYAGYVQADWNVTDALKLTAGVRYTDETKDFSIRENRPSCNDGTIEPTCMDEANLFGPSGLAIPTEQGTKLWTPRFAINYRPNDDILLFASATRGFKSGGWNARATAPSAFLPFGPEKVWSYELGTKSDWMDGRLRANVTLFYMDVSDLQTPSALINPVTGAITFITRNFADYENQGIELELTYLPIDGLNLYANVGYQDDEYKIDRNAPDFDEYGIQSVNAQQRLCQQQLATGAIPGGPGTAACAAGVIDARGEIADPVRTPDLTLAFGARYEIGLGSSGLSLVPSVNASYRSEQEVATANYTIYRGPITGTNGSFPANPFGGDYITGSHSDSLWSLNASLALVGADKRWELVAECINCTDETGVNTSLAVTSYINPPMTWLVRTRFNF
jgi:iron complex outermembrane receptor protein